MKGQQGYIKIVLVVFAVIIGLMIFPIKFPQSSPSSSSSSLSSAGECRAGEPGDGSLLRLPAIKDMYVPPFEPHPDDPSGRENIPVWGGMNLDEEADFVLIRKNVPTSKETIPAGFLFLGGSNKAENMHTINYGELPERPGFDAYYPSRWGELDLPQGRKWIRGLGLVFFANNDPSTIKSIDGKTVLQLDVYQDKRIFDDKTKDYTEEDIFICDASSLNSSADGSTSVVFPAQSVSQTKDQLQLEWFLFQSRTLWGVHCKPAVYLYPKRRQLVNVKVFPKGELTYTDPVYDPIKGWTVEAQPNGDLFSALSPEVSAKKYGYLYYESKLLDSEIKRSLPADAGKKPSKGWVVTHDGMESLLNRVLPELGLNKKEQADFMSYWLNKLPDSPYYFVGLVEKEQRDYLEALKVIPNPDTSIRFSLYFEMLNNPITVEEPEITTPERSGFTLVDWGGMVKLHPGTPFTCSQ